MNSISKFDAFYATPVETMQAKITTLESYKGQVLLIVNVASRCGFTSQYADLEALYQHFKARSFSVLGFPCDQFLHQEPGSNDEIKAFAESCFRVSFPLFAKIDVKGKAQAPIYHYLAKHCQKRPWKFFPWTFVPWNFTKFLVDAEGKVLKRYLPTASFKTIRKDIERLC